MKQSNAIFGAIAFSYVVYITGRGKLSLYLELLRGNKAAKPSSDAASSLSGKNVVKSILDGVKKGSNDIIKGIIPEAGSKSSTTPQTNTGTVGGDFMGEVQKVLQDPNYEPYSIPSKPMPDFNVGDTIEGYQQRVNDWKQGK